MKEIWVTFNKSAKNTYEVSNFGQVRKNGEIVICKPITGGHKDYGRYATLGGHYIHRIVAEYFVPNPHGKKSVNHKDGDKTNNHYTNLEWCTHQENVRHSFNVLGRSEPKAKGIRYTWSLHKGDRFIASFNSLAKLATYLNMPLVTASRIFQEDRLTKQGYKITREDPNTQEDVKTTQLF